MIMGKFSLNTNDLLWFVCKYCNRAFKQPKDLVSHKYKCHREQFTVHLKLKRNKDGTKFNNTDLITNGTKAAASSVPDSTRKSPRSTVSQGSSRRTSPRTPVKNGLPVAEPMECNTTTEVTIDDKFINVFQWFPPNSLHNSSSNTYVHLLKGVNSENGGRGGKHKKKTSTQAPELILDDVFPSLSSEDKIILKKIWGSSLKDEVPLWMLHPFWKLRAENRNFDDNIIESEREILPPLSLEAIQIANIDFELNDEFSKHNNHPYPLTFVSSNANFGEYFLWRFGSSVTGFGLHPSVSPNSGARRSCISYDTYEIYPGKEDETINILDIRTLNGFKGFVRSKTPNGQVDLFLADGVGQGSQRTHDLVLSQLLLALELLREGGNFIVRIPETTSHLATIDIFLMSRCFGQCTIMSPTSCFPGDYYVIGRWKRSVRDASAVKNSLYSYLESISDIGSSGLKKILPIFNDETDLKSLDNDFFLYLQQTNQEIAVKELKLYNLLKSLSLRRDSRSNPPKSKNSEMLLRKWNLIRCRDELTSPEIYFNETVPDKFWRRFWSSDQEAKDVLLQWGEESVDQAILEPKNLETTDLYLCTVSSGRKNRFIIISCGPDDTTYRWRNQTWEVVRQLRIPKGTVMLAEFCHSGKGKRRPVLSIVDALMLGQERVGSLAFENRILRCADFARRLDKPDQGVYRIMFAKVFPLSLLAPLVLDITASNFKVVLSNDDDMQPYPPPNTSWYREFVAREIFIFKAKTFQTNKDPVQSQALCEKDFKFVLANRLFWEWDQDSDLNSLMRTITEENSDDDCRMLFTFLSQASKSK